MKTIIRARSGTAPAAVRRARVTSLRRATQLPGSDVVVGHVALVHPERARAAGEPIAQGVGVVVGAGAAGLAAGEADQRVVGIAQVDRVAQAGAELERSVGERAVVHGPGRVGIAGRGERTHAEAPADPEQRARARALELVHEPHAVDLAPGPLLRVRRDLRAHGRPGLVERALDQSSRPCRGRAGRACARARGPGAGSACSSRVCASRETPRLSSSRRASRCRNTW